MISGGDVEPLEDYIAQLLILIFKVVSELECHGGHGRRIGRGAVGSWYATYCLSTHSRHSLSFAACSAFLPLTVVHSLFLAIFTNSYLHSFHFECCNDCIGYVYNIVSRRARVVGSHNQEAESEREEGD